jgi:membrane protein
MNKPDSPHKTRVPALLLMSSHLLSLAATDFFRNRCILWAAALTYTTVFALVPMLAVTFSLFHAFGALKGLEGKLRPFILQVLVPGAQEKLIGTIDTLIERLNAGAIGAVGTVLVFLAAVFLLAQLEVILNEIWGLKRHRPFFYRLAIYWTAITFGPPLMALSIGIPATLRSYRAVEWLEHYISVDLFRLLPYVFVWSIFTGIYLFMPNTRVKFSAAAVGAVVGGTLWQIAGVGFTLYTSTVLVYSALYGSLGVIPLFFLWLFISWSIFLFGAELSFVVQNYNLLRNGLKVYGPSYKEREYLSLRIVLTIAKNFLQGKSPLGLNDLTRQLRLPFHLTGELVESLARENIVIKLHQGSQDVYLPARNVDAITMSDIIQAVQGNQKLATESPEDQVILEAVVTGERMFAACAGNKSVKSILDELEALGDG